MLKVEKYHDFNHKKSIERQEKLSKEEALIRTLDVIDFYVALSSSSKSQSSKSEGQWINLEWHSNDK